MIRFHRLHAILHRSCNVTPIQQSLQYNKIDFEIAANTKSGQVSTVWKAVMAYCPLIKRGTFNRFNYDIRNIALQLEP